MSIQSNANPDDISERIATVEAQLQAQHCALRAVLDEFRRMVDDQPYGRIHYEAHEALTNAVPEGSRLQAAYTALGHLFRQDEV